LLVCIADPVVLVVVVLRRQAITDPQQRIAAARSSLLPARVSLIANASAMMFDHLSRVSSFGDLGGTSNILSQSLVHAIGDAPTNVCSATLRRLHVLPSQTCECGHVCLFCAAARITHQRDTAASRGGPHGL
jgi:hypothetical protein